MIYYVNHKTGEIYCGDMQKGDKKATKKEIDAYLNPKTTTESQRIKRQIAFMEEADPLKYDYEEACARNGFDSEEANEARKLWLAKKDEIREQYPYPKE